MKNKTYNIDYFIEKFSKIPNRKWGTYMYISEGRQCVLGHCGIYTDEAIALRLLFGSNKTEGGNIVIDINDGRDERYTQNTPKKRILAAIYDLKAKTTKTSTKIRLQESIPSELLKENIKETIDLVKKKRRKLSKSE